MIRRLRFTVNDFERLIGQGFFDRRSGPVELIDGELIEMSPASAEHEELIERLHQWSMDHTTRDRFRIRTQAGVAIPYSASLPEPDLVWLRPGDYRHRRPAAEDVALLIEVAISSLDYDRGPKAELYCRAAIDDYWIVNYPQRCVEVFRDPGADGYASQTVHQTGERIHPRCAPEAMLEIETLFQ